MRDSTRQLNLGDVERLTQFAQRAARPTSGFGYLDSTGQIDPTVPPSVLITSRMTFSFAVASELGFDSAHQLATQGIKSLIEDFLDAKNGGFCSSPANEDSGGLKSAYDTSFVLLAGATAHAVGVAGAERVAEHALETLLTHFWKDDLGIFANSFSQDFSVSEDYLGANANMHLVESLLAASYAFRDSSLLDRALRIADFMINVQARAHDWCLPEHFDTSGEPNLEFNKLTPADEFRPYGVTVGHLFEWSRLLLELLHSGVSGTEWIPLAAQNLYGTARKTGWKTDGEEGFVYTLDWNRNPLVTERLMWVVAEAISAAAQISLSELSLTACEDISVWSSHLKNRFMDAGRGGWHHELTAQGEPSEKIAKGKPDAYHLLQAFLIPQLPGGISLIDRLRNYSKPGGRND